MFKKPGLWNKRSKKSREIPVRANQALNNIPDQAMKLKPLSLVLLALTVPCFLQGGSATDEVGEGDIQASLQPRSLYGAKMCFPPVVEWCM